ELVAGVFELLDPLQHGGFSLACRHAQRGGAQAYRAPPGELAHHHAHLVPHERWIDVLVALGDLGHGGDVYPAFVGEGAPAHVGGVGIGVQVRDGRHEVRRVAQLSQAFRRDDLVIELELQGGDQRHQVQVPATLTVSVDGPLNVDAAGLDVGEGIRERQPAVV